MEVQETDIGPIVKLDHEEKLQLKFKSQVDTVRTISWALVWRFL